MPPVLRSAVQMLSTDAASSSEGSAFTVSPVGPVPTMTLAVSMPGCDELALSAGTAAEPVRAHTHTHTHTHRGSRGAEALHHARPGCARPHRPQR
eukprot:1159929-Pelagomonas_calceolata.AAC.23